MAKSMQDKQDKFVELADKRGANAIKYLRLLSNLGNKASYAYSVDQAEHIITAVFDEAEAMRDALLRAKAPRTLFSVPASSDPAEWDW